MTAGRSAGTEQGRGQGYRCTCSPLDRACPTPDECDVYAAPSVPPARDSGRDEAREAVARFSELLVPVEDHALACQDCGSLVLNNPNALTMHTRFHAAALLRDGTTT